MQFKLLVIGLGIFTFCAAGLGIRLSHDSDDEVIYTALAAKIQKEGFKNYNLRDISIERAGFFWDIRHQEKGNLLELLTQSGAGYYDTDFYFNPPLFPALLAASNRILHPDSFLVLGRNMPQAFYFEQLWAVIPNVLLSVFFLAGIFVLANKSEKGTGVWALWLCGVSPVFLIAVFKAWSDILAATLILWSFIAWDQEEKKIQNLFLSAVLCGLALWTRTSSLFAIPIFLCCKWKRFPAWFGVVFLVAGYWFFSLYRYHGMAFYFPALGALNNRPEWLAIIHKPWHRYLYDLFYLSPLFLGVLFAGWKPETRLFWIWILSFIVPFSLLLHSNKPLGLEDRYLLPAYPAMAVLAAYGIKNIQKIVPKYFFLVIAGVGTLWSLRLAIGLVFSRESLNFL